jgi:transposase
VVADRGATVTQTCRDLGVSWPVVMAAVADHAERALPGEPEPVTVLGIDETYRGRRRWRRDPDTGRWEPATDRWHVGFVDISGGQGLLGQVEGRTAEAVVEWLTEREAAWREAVRHVAIDMSSVFLSAVRQALPHAVVVVDHFHVVQLANQAVTEMRRRITFTLRGRRGRASDGEWQIRRLLIRARENLSERRSAKLWNTLVDLGDPGYDILAAYIAKEKLREVLALARTGPDPHRIRQRPGDFYHWYAGTGLPEIERLTATIEQWWPHIEQFLHTGISNAASEDVNHVVKLTGRNAYRFRNPINQRLRIPCAATRRAHGHLKPG